MSSKDTPLLLLVESDILVRHPLAQYLRECGFMVIEAANADEARQLLLESGRKIDVVLADAGHDQGSGFSLAAWIRSHFPNIDVSLAGTMTRAVERAGELCEDGPAGRRPYDHQLLLNQIKRLLAARERPRPGRNGPTRSGLRAVR